MSDPTSELTEVRCPFQKKDKFTNVLRACNCLIVKANPGSSGEAKCPKCNLVFEFEIVNQQASKTRVRPLPA